ncbi:cell division protein ZapA [Celerinatantimonas diazotrophica]|uniref:Cell division protein ZapA n=1 Tax=Celerinatantimonas diazotrophica TaxID=412034 RepID=A0A4R1J8T0_9GAMM|nr:cell division protein ZapA [Celerinatantimonas diazotrophica]TCK47002.1 cell division protein ZapA [Celerinatantimonas diazotrophica]CAG9295770.1 Cell division protein ZapA [Celerinatantimonas diazotrophica]
MSKAVDIILLGKTYRVACPEGQEQALHEAAAELAARLAEAHAKMPSNNEQLAMMVALNLSSELLCEKQKNIEYAKNMDERIRSLQNTIEQALLENSSINR